MNIMNHTTDKIETYIRPLTSLLKVFAMFIMRLWYDNENVEDNVIDNIGIRCRNCVKTTVLSVKNTNY